MISIEDAENGIVLRYVPMEGPDNIFIFQYDEIEKMFDLISDIILPTETEEIEEDEFDQIYEDKREPYAGC